MTNYSAPANGTDTITLSANSPSLDLLEYFEQTCDSKLELLERLRILNQWTTAAIEDAVTDARTVGHSWAAIGDALEVTKQAAQQRYWTRND